MADRARDRDTYSDDLSTEWTAAKDDESRRKNSPSGASAIHSTATEEEEVGRSERQVLLRRPTRLRTADQNEDEEDDPLPVPVVRVELVFEDGRLPIPSLPHPPLDASLKSEAFDDIRRLTMTTAQQEDHDHHADHVFSENDEDEEQEEECFDGPKDQGLVAVHSLRFFLANIKCFNDATMT